MMSMAPSPLESDVKITPKAPLQTVAGINFGGVDEAFPTAGTVVNRSPNTAGVARSADDMCWVVGGHR
jgi:hypothetical protein